MLVKRTFGNKVDCEYESLLLPRRSWQPTACHRFRPSLLPLAALAVSLFAQRSPAQTNDIAKSASELKNMSLQQLFDMEVTSVSKKPEKLSETAAAIHVVTDEDIRRSGALSIPEALRDIPGVEV